MSYRTALLFVSVRIRRCTIDDAPSLAALARRTFYDTFPGTCSEDDMQHFLDTFYDDEVIRAELNNKADFYFFAEDEAGIPVAYIRFLQSPLPFSCDDCAKPLELSRLYVDAPYKGAGVAQLLMDFYLQWAEEAGHDLLWLGVWEHNYRAQAFYRRYGFRFTGYTHPFPIGNTQQTDEWWSLKFKR